MRLCRNHTLLCNTGYDLLAPDYVEVLPDACKPEYIEIVFKFLGITTTDIAWDNLGATLALYNVHTKRKITEDFHIVLTPTALPQNVYLLF